MDSEDYETESNKPTGNFNHLKGLISTHVNNISTSPSEVETEGQNHHLEVFHGLTKD